MRKRPTPLFAIAILSLALLVPATVEAQSRKIKFIRDAEIESIIRAYATPLLQAAGLSPKDVDIYLIEDRAINAFTTGGLNIFIHTGLLMRAKDPAEVIGVVAHEIGHIVGGHVISRQIELENATIKALATQLVGLGVAIAAGRPEVAAAAGIGGQDLALKGLLSFTRSQEQAADQTAVRLLKGTRQSPRGMVELLQLLQDQEVLLAASQDPYLRTHPLTSERVDFAERALEESPYADVPVPPNLIHLHDRMRAKLSGFLDSPTKVFRSYPESDKSVPARYAQAIAYYRRQALDKSLPIIDGLLAELPKDPYFNELRGQMLFENGRIAEALPHYETAVELRPDSATLRRSLAHVQVELNDRSLDRKALENLDAALQIEPGSSFAWRLAAIAHDRLGDNGMKYLALAEESLARGRLPEAREQAGRAQELLPDYSPGWLRAEDVANLAERLESRKSKKQ